jgi:hypothetical protein
MCSIWQARIHMVVTNTRFCSKRYVGITERLAGGPLYEDAKLASKQWGKGIADARDVWASDLMADRVRGRVAVANRHAYSPICINGQESALWLSRRP